MNYKKIEELFVDFILDLTGPSPELEKEREERFGITKNIIINKLNAKFPFYNTYILPYGSHPMKVYLKNADIDITIILQSKEEKNVIMEMQIDLINHILLLIKEEFELYNKNASIALFSELKIIMADVRLLKGKIGNISLDISVNNFSGIYKVILIKYIENQFKNEFSRLNLFSDSSYSNNKIQIFRRTLILIKSWCTFEGNLMGSNIGLMASYALEILVIYLFNLHYDNIYNEFDGFEKFFEVMDKFDWENSIITLFDIYQSSDFQKNVDNYNRFKPKTYIIGSKNYYSNNNNTNNINEPFWYLPSKKGKDSNTFNPISMKRVDLNENEDGNNHANVSLLKPNEIIKLIEPINRSMGNIYLKKEERIINPKNFEKLINILDPLNNHNNLGKSISLHSKSKMKKIISHMNKLFKYIHKIRKKGNPFLYINSLLNLFKITLSTTYIELFVNYINCPRIIANSKFLKDSKKANEKKNTKKLSKDEFYKFNSLFINEKINPNLNYKEEEDYDKYVEESEKSSESEEEKKEKDIEDDYEQDEYAEEEEEENYEYADEKKNIKSNDNDEKINFVNLINSKIIKKLTELNENKQKTINFNNDLLEQSLEYSYYLEKLLKENKLI